MARLRLVFAVSSAISLVVVGALALNFMGRSLGENSAYGRVAGAIGKAALELNVKPRTIELTSEKAVRARNAIKHGDYSTAHQIAADVLANSHLQNWRFYPFSDFIKAITSVNDPTLGTHLDAWVVQNKNDAIALLIRAQYHYDIGWFMRGHHFVRDTQASHMAMFVSDMAKARADIDAALQLNDGNPYSFDLKLRILQGAGAGPEMKNTFDAAITKYPSYYPLYEIVLHTLEPKWGGSVTAMYAFVDRYAGRATQYSPMKFLYLELYRSLLGSASTACSNYWHDKDKKTQCITSFMQKNIRPDLDGPVLEALQLYDHSDRYQFGVVIEAMLFDMLKTLGAEAYSGAMLQSAASSMHSDTQLTEDKPGHNNYVIDKAVSESWYVKGFYENALKKDLEALKDAEATVFADEEEKDLALAGVYDNLAGTYNKLNQYADMIAYEEAAIALGGKAATNQVFVCYGYYRLKDYDAAVQACTKTITDDAANLQARYWRGVAYRDSDQLDAALQDLTMIADSEDNFRISAAIDMSLIYFNRKDPQSALNILNKYTYLYDPNLDSRADIAVSYNNRCYAYMLLGELKKALADCEASLKYGSIPDAFRKEQELIRRLKAGETGL